MAQITLNSTGVASNGALVLQSNGTTAAVNVSTAQNVGIGVAPSTNSANTSIEINKAGNGLSVFSNTDFRISRNVYDDGAKYARSGETALTYILGNGTFAWYNAPAGTAGNAITFTQAMTLNASAQLSINTTALATGCNLNVLGGINSTNGGLNVAGNGGFYNGANKFGVDNSAGATRMYSSGANSSTRGSYEFHITDSVGTLDNTAMVLDASGNLLVGTTGTLISSASRIRVTTGSGPTLDVQQTGGAGTSCGAFWNTATSGDNIFHLFYTEAGGTFRGSITYNRAGGLVAYNTTSDYRAKDISGSITDSGALIDSTPVYMGKMKGATQERPMFIAHETPEYAHTGEKDAVDADGNPVYQQMDASALIPLMWAEIQSLRKRLAAAGI